MHKNPKKMRIQYLLLSLITIAPICLNGADGFTLVWSDEFDYTGTPDPEKWGYDLGAGGWGNNENQAYTKELENVRVEDGMLLIQAQQVDGGRTPAYTSARIVTKEKQSIQYGRVEVMAKIPSETGTWSAIWMLPTDALLAESYWPDNGEIDIMEHVGYEEDPLFLAEKGVSYINNLHSTIHTDARNGRDNQGIGKSTYVPDASTEFHLYAMNWYPDRLEFFVDDVNTFTIWNDQVGIPTRNPPEEIWPWWPFTQRFHLIMNIAVGGNWGGHFNSTFYPNGPYLSDGIDHEGIWPQTMAVDYVRMYELESRVDPVSELPGKILPEDYADEYGILFENSDHDESSLSLYNLDAGDFVEFEVMAAAEGAYDLSFFASGLSVDHEIGLTNLTTESSQMISYSGTGGLDLWEWSTLGTVNLARGPNRIRFQFDGKSMKFGSVKVDSPESGMWKGFPVDSLGVIDTGNWMGLLGTADQPWLYAPRIDSWVYPISMGEETLRTANQWVFVFSPKSLVPYDEAYVPWYYSVALNRWFYTTQPIADDPPVWLFIY